MSGERGREALEERPPPGMYEELLRAPPDEMEGGGVADEVEGVPVPPPPPLKYDLMPVCWWSEEGRGGLGDLFGK